MINGYRCILGSASPRRINLLNEIGILDEVIVRSTDETWPEDILSHQVAEFIAIKKAEAFNDYIALGTLLITADTTVICDQTILNKPNSIHEAFEMLKLLSGKKHQVITGVCLKTSSERTSFSETTDVYFTKLEDDFLWEYVHSGAPMDKAGAYGI